MDPSAPSGHLLPFGYSSADRTLSYVSWSMTDFNFLFLFKLEM